MSGEFTKIFAVFQSTQFVMVNNFGTQKHNEIRFKKSSQILKTVRKIRLAQNHAKYWLKIKYFSSNCYETW